MKLLEIDTTILALFKKALLASYSQINELLSVQQFLGLRKKSENCIYNTLEAIAPVNEQPDNSIFDIKSELIHRFTNKKA